MLNKTTESVNPTDKKEESKPVKLGDKEIIRLEQRQPQHKIVAERERQKLEEAGKKLEEIEKRLEEAEKLKAEKLRAEELKAEKLEAEEREEELFKIMEYKAEKLEAKKSESSELKIKQPEGNKFEIENLQPVKRYNFALLRESNSSAMPSVDVSFDNYDENVDLTAHGKTYDICLLKEPTEDLEEDLEIDQEVGSNRSPKNE